MLKSCMYFVVLAVMSVSAIAQPVTGDLGITNVQITPDPAQSGATVRVDVTVRNFGPGIGQLVEVEIDVNGVQQVSVAPLDIFPTPGTVITKSYFVTMPIVAPDTSENAIVDVSIRGGGDSNFSNNFATEFPSVIGPQRPDLECVTPSGWEGPIVVSTVPGTNTQSTVITDQDTLYIDFAAYNSGGDMPSGQGGVQFQLFLDSFTLLDTPFAPWDQGVGVVFEDEVLGTLSAGTYTLRIVLDAIGSVNESDETNNECTYQFTVAPTQADIDLTFVTPTGWPAPMVLSSAPGDQVQQSQYIVGDTVYLDLAYINFGTEQSGLFRLEVMIDGQPEAFLDDNIEPNVAFGIIDYAIEGLSPGMHTISATIDSLMEVSETDETNNTISMMIEVVDPVSCPADLTGDNILDFFDISTFLTAYSNADLVADFSGDGILDFFDISAFLTAYSQGCP